MTPPQAAFDAADGARPIPLHPPRSRNRALARALDGTGAAWLLVLPVVLLGLCLVVPLVAVATTALDAGLGRAIDVVSDDLFVEAVRRTVVMATLVTLITLVVGTLYSLGLGLSTGLVRILLFASLFVTFWISIMVRTYGWVVLLSPTGVLYKALEAVGLASAPLDVLQTTPAMYPGMVHVMLPYMILPIYAGVIAIDPAQIKAAQSLGARPLQLVLRVVIPQLRTGALAGTILVFILSLGFFITPRFLGGPSDLTVATIIDRAFSQVFDFAAASAMGLTLLIAVLLLFVLADRVLRVSAQWGRM